MKKYEEEYHLKQIDSPYRSTVMFTNWLERIFVRGGGVHVMS